MEWSHRITSSLIHIAETVSIINFSVLLIAVEIDSVDMLIAAENSSPWNREWSRIQFVRNSNYYLCRHSQRAYFLSVFFIDSSQMISFLSQLWSGFSFVKRSISERASSKFIKQFFLLVALLSVSLFLFHFMHTKKKNQKLHRKKLFKNSAPVYMAKCIEHRTLGNEYWWQKSKEFMQFHRLENAFHVTQSCMRIILFVNIQRLHSALCTMADFVFIADVYQGCVVWGNLKFFVNILSRLFFDLIGSFCWFKYWRYLCRKHSLPNHSRFIWWRRSTHEQAFCNQFCY